MVVSSISDMENKRMLGPGLLQWMREHTGELKKWMDENVAYNDRDPFIERISGDELLLYAMYLVLQQAKKPNEDKIIGMVRDLADSSGKLWLIIGAKRSGKTSLLHIIGESFKTLSKRPVWWYGPPAKLPPYIDGQTLDQDKIPPGSLVLIDEASILFMSRLHDETSLDFIKRIPVLAHADKNYIFCTQSSAITDVNIARLADAFIFKSYSVIQGGGGRMDRIRVSDQLKFFMPNKVEEAMYFDNTKLMLFTYPLPEWWNDAYSKPYAPFGNEAEYYRFVLSVLADGVTVKKAIEVTGLRGRAVTQNDLESIRMLADHYGIAELMSHDDATLVELLTAGFDDTPINLQAEGTFSKIRGNFTLPPFDAETDARRRRNDMEYDLMSRRNVNQLFIDHYRFRVEHDGNLIMSVIGLQQQTTRGTGKSWGTLSLGVFCNSFFKKPFTAANVKFDPNDVIKAAGELKERDTITQDEQRKEDAIGTGAGAIRMEAADFEDTIRKKQLNLIYASPSLRIHNNDLILEAYGIDYKQRISRFLVYQRYPGVPLGYITLAAPSDALVKDYEKRKDAFLEDILARETMMKKLKGEAAKKLAQDEVFMKMRGKEKKLAYIRKRFPELRTRSSQEDVMNDVEIANI